MKEQIQCLEGLVDLGESPSRLFSKNDLFFTIKHEGKGIVEVELREDGYLYVGEERVNLFLSDRQKGNSEIEANDLREEVESMECGSLNMNVLDHLFRNPELCPVDWKKEKNGKVLYVIFWDTIIRDFYDIECAPMDLLVEYVPCFYWENGNAHWGWISLSSRLGDNFMSAIIER